MRCLMMDGKFTRCSKGFRTIRAVLILPRKLYYPLVHLTVFYAALEVHTRPHDLWHELLRATVVNAVIGASAASKIVSKGD